MEEATEILNEQISQTLDDVDKSAMRQYARRPRFNFHEMGIPNGEMITFYSEDELLEAEVVPGNQVSYNGENYSLTKLTAKLLGYNYNVRPMRFWTYKGKSLQEYYDEAYGEIE